MKGIRKPCTGRRTAILTTTIRRVLMNSYKKALKQPALFSSTIPTAFILLLSMPKFKPKKFLIRVLGGKSRNKEDAMDYLTTGFQRFLLGTHSHANIREVDDDCDSMISVLTMETVDNQPGTGRFIDKYIFQPLGRRIERLAMRYTIASLHPARIAQYIEAEHTDLNPSFDNEMTLNDAIARLCRGRNGSTVVAGMKGLVKQTQCVPHAFPWTPSTANTN